MIGDAMDTSRLRRTSPRLTAAAITLMWIIPASAQQQTSPPQRPAGAVIRGCLTGSKLTHIDPGNVTLSLPDTLTVRSVRVIRDQVKALNGHTVEVAGKLRGIPGQETGLLVVDSDDVKVYLGGGDTRPGSDLAPATKEMPTIYAHTIKNVADTCSTALPE
jgi:hypothetical protein